MHAVTKHIHVTSFPMREIVSTLTMPFAYNRPVSQMTKMGAP